MDHRIYLPGERPDIEVLVDGVGCEGASWTQREDGSWRGNVQWRPNGEPTRRLDTFVADLIRPGIGAPEAAICSMFHEAPRSPATINGAVTFLIWRPHFPTRA